ncbi:MAG: hypothetical protein ACTS10_20250 [Kiloniellales bacterium]
MVGVFYQAADTAKICIEKWPHIIKFLQTAEGPGGERLNQETEVPGTGVELSWFDERVIAVCGLVSGLDKIKSGANPPIPLDYASNLNTNSTEIRNIIVDLESISKEINENGIESLNPSNYIIIIKSNNNEYNIASHLQNLMNYLEIQLKQYLTISVVLKDASFSGFSEGIHELSKNAKQLRDNAAAALNAARQTEEAQKATLELKEKANIDQISIAEALNTANGKLSEAEAIGQKIISQLDKIEELNTHANALTIKVEQYKNDFIDFQDKINERNKSFSEWEAKTENLYSQLSDQKKQIQITTETAEKMLVGATNAGLSGTFKSNLDDLDEKLRRAQSEFYGAIWFVFLSALPLSAYVITVTVMAISPNFSALDASEQTSGFLDDLTQAIRSDGLTLSATLALFLIMIPSIWRAKFSASKYQQIFKLREHYQYKYSVAMAVDGFKKQAPEYADAIAAEAFNQLLFNPADRLSGIKLENTESCPSPLMDSLMNKFGFNAGGQKR